jgi:hypothetical protein
MSSERSVSKKPHSGPGPNPDAPFATYLTPYQITLTFTVPAETLREAEKFGQHVARWIADHECSITHTEIRSPHFGTGYPLP